MEKSDKAEKLERLPPIAPAFRSYDYDYPRSLVLFLQCAPHKVVLAAFQADCETRDISWCSTRAQELAVEWFLHHPVARKYPPRSRMLRALLKSYITAIGEQQVAELAHDSASSEEEPIHVDLMEAYIGLSVSGGEDFRGPEMSFKNFFNPYVSGGDSPPLQACTAAIPAPPTSLTMASPLVHLTATHSSPSQLTAPSGGFRSAAAAAAAAAAARAMSEPTHPSAPLRTLAEADGDDLQPMPNVRATPPTTPPRSPFRLGSNALLTPPLPPPPVVPVEKLMEQFCAIRVANEQFSNVGLSLWPAAFVLVQLLAQELKGETHLLSDVLGLPRASSAMMGSSSTTSMPPLAAPHRIFASPIPTPPSSPPSAARGKRPGMGGGTGNAASSTAAKPYSSQLKILELGAGVGLTPVFLNHMEEYRQHVSTFLVTDYQDAIVDNIKFNLVENGITPIEDFTAAKRGLEGDQTPPFHRAALLDWEQHVENEGMFMENSVDVVLAADCIYDVEVIPALVDTIHLALTAEDISSYLTSCSRLPPGRGDMNGGGGNSSNGSSTTSGPTVPPAAPQKQRCCVVVQTHRQNSTMQTFFSAVRKFGQVKSYTLVRQPVGSLRMSSDGTGIDGGCVPLGSWDRQAAMLNPDRIVCALRPDVVLEDGSLRSAAHRTASQHASAGPGSASNSISVPSPSGTARTHTRSNFFPAPHNLPTPNFGKETPALTPLHSSRSNNSVDSRTSFSRASSAAVLEAAEALLADDMIGPFYTTMVGLIGVHVITLKPTKRVTR